MIITQGNLGDFEKVFASFYLAWNEWFRHDEYHTGNAVKAGKRQRFSHRGLYCGLVMHDDFYSSAAAPFDTTVALTGSQIIESTQVEYHKFGLAVCVPGSTLSFLDSIMCPVGAIETEMISTYDRCSGCWVLLQLYGYHDSLAVKGTVSADDMYLQMNTSGELSGINRAALTSAATRRMMGAVVIDTSGASALLDLTGTNQAGTNWVQPPWIDNDDFLSSGGAVSPSGTAIPYQPIVAVKRRNTPVPNYWKSATTNPDTESTCAGGPVAHTEGFIYNLGINTMGL